MLVSHNKKFIYFKTIKTAGTSVESFFEPFCMPKEYWKLDVFNHGSDTADGIVGYRGVKPKRWFGLARRRWYDHMPAKFIKKQLSPNIWDSYYKFCVVRNPFDKAISAFHFHQWMENRGLSKMSVPKTGSDVSRFRSWVELDIGKRYLLLDRPCYVVDNELVTDFEIRFENLLDDLAKVCHQLNIDRDLVELPRFTSGVRPDLPLQDYYDTATRKTIERVFAFELDRFGYEFPS